MKTARELAHDFLLLISGEDGMSFIDFDGAGGHSLYCDQVTAAIEVRDGEHAAASLASADIAFKVRAERDAALAALRLAKAALMNSEQRCHDCGPDAVSALAAIARLLPSVPS